MKKTIKRLDATMENLPIIQDLSRAHGLINAVHETTKGARRATVLEKAMDLIERHLPKFP